MPYNTYSLNRSLAFCAEEGSSSAIASQVNLTDSQLQRRKEEAERARQVDGILFNVMQAVSSFLMSHSLVSNGQVKRQ